ncbi:MAG TPA: response regulator transcription factor [Usitatibacter sp.]|jgi:DNA-binding NarL/FixJ family response regulator|nr:response regulator transcription factor [Usitatibacter sp.]
MIRVLIADGHVVVAQGLGCLLARQGDIEVLGFAPTGSHAVEGTLKYRPDVVLMDYRMPDLDGIEATRLVLQRLPTVRVVMLSQESEAHHVARAICAGACGYVTKQASCDELVRAIRAAYAGRRYLDRRVEGDVLGELAGRGRGDPVTTLSPRERQILQLLSIGRTNAQIAQLLCLSARTVETYRARLMKKLAIRDLPSLVRFAIRNGLSPLE